MMGKKYEIFKVINIKQHKKSRKQIDERFVIDISFDIRPTVFISRKKISSLIALNVHLSLVNEEHLITDIINDLRTAVFNILEQKITCTKYLYDLRTAVLIP